MPSPGLRCTFAAEPSRLPGRRIFAGYEETMRAIRIRCKDEMRTFNAGTRWRLFRTDTPFSGNSVSTFSRVLCSVPQQHSHAIVVLRGRWPRCHATRPAARVIPNCFRRLMLLPEIGLGRRLQNASDARAKPSAQGRRRQIKRTNAVRRRSVRVLPNRAEKRFSTASRDRRQAGRIALSDCKSEVWRVN